MQVAHESTRPLAPRPGGALGALRAAGGLLLRQPRALAWIAPALWAALIWLLSSHPVGKPVAPDLLHSFVWNLAHGPEFGILMLLLLPLAPRRDGWAVLGRSPLVALAAVAGAYALVDELHQASVPGRSSSLTDVLTDWIAIAAVVVVARHVSSPAATPRGLLRRLAAGAVAVAGGAGLATVEHLITFSR